jgi:hypothetical protein
MQPSVDRGSPEFGEAGCRESSVIVELLEGAGVERMQQRPFGGLDLITMAGLDGQSAVLHLPPFGSDLAPLGGTESGQVAIEVTAAGVLPMKLNIMAEQQSGTLQQRDFVVTGQRHVPRRSTGADRQRARAIDQGLPDGNSVRPLPDQDARPGNRRVRYAAHQLRVILAADLPVSRRPRPVVDEIAVRMRFAVQRQQTDDRTPLVACHQMPGGPPPGGRRRPMALDDCQKISIEERMPDRQRRVHASRATALAAGILLITSGDGKPVS